MLNLQRVNIFVAVVDSGSFTAAAKLLGHTRAVISFNIKQLESDLDVSLLTRTTRRLMLTEAGQRFYTHGRRLLQDASLAEEDVRSGHQGLNGLLRITTTQEYGVYKIVPKLAAFSQMHPQLKIEHSASSHHANLVAERFDIAIRLGQIADTGYRAALVETFSVVPVASPDYLRSVDAQEPINLHDLKALRWMVHSRLDTPLIWKVQTPNKIQEVLDMQTEAAITADSSSALREFALRGAGAALLPEWLIADDIAAGRLLHLLPDYRFPTQAVSAIYPNTRHIPAKVRAFIDFLKKADER